MDSLKFVGIVGREGSYIGFEFEKHETYAVNLGDIIWSDRRIIFIHETVKESELKDLIADVDNYRAFKGALIRMDLL